MKNVMLFLLLTAAFVSCSKDDDSESFAAADYIGTFGRVDNCNDAVGSTMIYDDVSIVYGTSGGIILKEYATGRGWALPGSGDINGTVNGNTVTLSGNYTYTASWGTREWEFTGTGKLSNDKSKLTIDYNLYYEDENGVVRDITCISTLTRK